MFFHNKFGRVFKVRFIHCVLIIIMQSGTIITSLNLDAELVNKAQDFGLNLSKWVNSKFKEFFYGSFMPSNQVPNESSMTKELVVRMSPQFKAWLVSNRNDKRYIASLENHLTKYFTGLILNSPQNIIEYTSKMKTTSKYPILALRLYIKYLEEVGQITSEQGVQLKRVLKVKKSKPDNYVPTDDRIREVIGKLTDQRDKIFFQILAYSGARITEMSKMLSEYDPKIFTGISHLPGIR